MAAGIPEASLSCRVEVRKLQPPSLAATLETVLLAAGLKLRGRSTTDLVNRMASFTEKRECMVVEDVDAMDPEDLGRVGKMALRAKINTIFTGREKLVLEGYNTIFLRDYSLEDLRWIALVHSLACGLELDDEAVALVSAYAQGRRQTWTVVELADTLAEKGASTPKEVQSAIEEHRDRIVKGILETLNLVEKECFDLLREAGEGGVLSAEMNEHFMRMSRQLGYPETEYAYNNMLRKFRSSACSTRRKKA